MAESLRVCVVHAAGPHEAVECHLSLPPGSTVGQALQQSGLWQPEGYTGGLGVWGQPASLAQLLRDQDRVELYRALTVDPKQARRERFVQQGKRSAGLFKRVGPPKE